MASLFAPGNAVTAGKLNGAWTSYSTAWTATISNPALGNGSLLSYWARLGNMMAISISLTMGSTTTYGSGAWLFSLPVASLSATVTPFGMGEVWGLDSGTDFYNGNVGLFTTTTIFLDSENSWFATSPFTWGTNDSLVATGWFPIA